MANSEPDFSRKKPRQARARLTIDTILEATARILAEEGGEKLTTNHLAERSGYSIGTIYQYFENREAVVISLIERQREVVEGEIDALLEARRDDPWDEQVRGIVRLLHEAFARHGGSDPRLVRALVAFSLDRGLPEPSDRFVQAIIDVWRQAAGEGAPAMDEAEVFTLGRAVSEVLRRAALQSSPLLGTRALEEAIVRLVLGFLGQPGAAQAGA
ncbi:TetR/AcrR family transcriptional regulator [Novosphingobium profundi]|uniref:TetR/AcrR family transcriptional regulator n=1 Tax=Novosphingobium profundi TaxID=1774954 RepID=UPI001BDB462B|nr:TetR/AcrR family transcriptional regulator [Novosphingobium profundi]MBT0669156.1 TetR/AcrR family transcriptional regulator [Novosphingobium profundi]